MKWWEILWKQNPETDIDHSRGPDPDDLTVDNAYKTRWIWYHTILAIGIFMSNILSVSYTHLTLPTKA